MGRARHWAHRHGLSWDCSLEVSGVVVHALPAQSPELNPSGALQFMVDMHHLIAAVAGVLETGASMHVAIFCDAARFALAPRLLVQPAGAFASMPCQLVYRQEVCTSLIKAFLQS